MLLVCQSILPPSLRGWENQAIFATRSPTAIRDIRPFRPRRKQIPETSRSGTSTTRRTRSRFLFDLPGSRWERVSADIKENVQPLPDDFSSFLLKFISKNSNVRSGQRGGLYRFASRLIDAGAASSFRLLTSFATRCCRHALVAATGQNYC